MSVNLLLCFGCVFITICFQISGGSLPVHSCRRVPGDVIHQSYVALIQLHSQRVMILLIKQHAVVLISSHLNVDRNKKHKLTVTPNPRNGGKKTAGFNTWSLVGHINQKSLSR